MSSANGNTPDDVIIVGGGHNGLTCAAYLAREGKRVLVLEANSHVGGLCVTEELVAEAPGFKSNSYALDFMTSHIGRSVIDELELHRFGLEFVLIDPYQTYLSPEGTWWNTWHSLEKTCESIARLSKADARYYRELIEPLIGVIRTVIPYLQDHPTRPQPRTVAQLAGRALRYRRDLGPAGRVMLSSPLEIIDGFEREELRSFFAGLSTGNLGPLEEPNGAMFLHQAIMHEVQLRRPVGGSGAFTQALAACVESYGGTIRTAAPVERVVVERGRACGVVLRSGEELAAAEVVGAVDPTMLFSKLLDPEVVPEQVAKEVSRLQINRHGIGVFKGDIALSKRPAFPDYDVPGDQCHSFIFSSNVETVQISLEMALRGEYDENVPFYFAMPSIPDRAMVPEGSEGEVGYLYPLTPPIEFADGRDWDDVKYEYMNSCLDRLEKVSPGFKDLIVGTHARSPKDINAPWVHKGAIWGVDVIPSQMGPWRPCPSLSGYRTPIDGLWHTGPGAHPMPGISGWSGRTAAATILKRGRRRPRRARPYPRPRRS